MAFCRYRRRPLEADTVLEPLAILEHRQRPRRRSRHPGFICNVFHRGGHRDISVRATLPSSNQEGQVVDYLVVVNQQHLLVRNS
jgi:hypothetical protein